MLSSNAAGRAEPSTIISAWHKETHVATNKPAKLLITKGSQVKAID